MATSKPRNNDSTENQKVSKKTGNHPKIVKSTRKRGGQSKYTEEIAAKIVELMSGGTFLRVICRMEGMPSWTTVYAWMDNDAVFAERIARARERGEEAIIQECLEIADTPQIGEETESSENGMKVRRADMLGHRKLQVDVRMRILAKWNPKKWGEKVAIGGADDLPPLRSMTEKDLDQQIAELQSKDKT